MADYLLNFEHLINDASDPSILPVSMTALPSGDRRALLLVHVYFKYLLLLCMAFVVNKAPFEWDL